MKGAVIRIDRPVTVPTEYVRKVSHPHPVTGMRDFTVTRCKREARRMTLETAADVIRTLGPTCMQFSVCDAPGAAA